MKKLFQLIVAYCCFISAVAAQTMFDWENGSTSQTKDGITATVTGAGGKIVNSGLGGYAGTTGQTVFAQTPASSMTITFSKAVNLTSIFAFDVSAANGSTWTFTPTGGNNSAVTTAISTSTGSIVNLNWAGVTQVVMTSSAGNENFGIDNTVISTPAVAPVFESGTPSASNVTQTGFTLAADIDKAGTIYYAIVADGAAAPMSADVKAATVSNSVATGNQAVNSGGFSHNFSVTGLSASTAYDVYVVAEDTGGALQASPDKIDVTTLALPVAISVNDVSKNEGDSGITKLQFTLSLDNPAPAGGATVNYSTANGTATAGSDYTATSGTLSFLSGETSKTVDITLVGDETVEADETFTLSLSNATGTNVSIADAIGAGTITNDDQASVTIADVSVNENAGTATMTLTLDSAVDDGFSVDVSTADGTAMTADSDYTAVTNQTLTFAGTAGETDTVTVSLGGDTKVEADETVSISMSNLTATKVSSSNINSTDTATLTIENDDIVRLTINNVSGNEDDGAITLTVTLDNAVDDGFSIDVSTADGTATTANSDYTAITGETLTFAGAASETQTFAVMPTADSDAEPNETVYISMSNVVAATVSNDDIYASDTATVTILDDDNTSPTIAGTASGQTVNDNDTINPFSTVTIADAENDNVSATITLDDNAKGELSGAGLTGSGSYTIASTTVADLQTKLRSLVYNPTDNRSATSETTTFIVEVSDGRETASDGKTTVVSNAVAPVVTSVSVPAYATYTAGQDLDFTVNFSENVNVVTTGGTPQLAITVGSTVRQATYVNVSGTGTSVLFKYTVQTGEEDTDGIAVGSLTANGGTLKDAGDKVVNVTLNSVGSTINVLVDAVAPADPVVTSPASAIAVNAATQTISGTHIENGVTVHVYLDADNNGAADNTTPLGSATVVSNEWSFIVNLTADSANDFVVQTVDGVGNTSNAVDVSTITEDSMSPVAPVVTTPVSAIAVNAATQTIAGTHSENGVTVHAYLDADNNDIADNKTSLGSAIVASNKWSFVVNLAADIDNNFVVQAVDDAGNMSNDVNVPTITEIAQAPTITGVPNIPTAVTQGMAADLVNFTVADADSANLSVAFELTNGTVTDGTNATVTSLTSAPITTINNQLAGLQFTGTTVGGAFIKITVSDDTGETAMAYYNFVVQAPGNNVGSVSITGGSNPPSQGDELTASVSDGDGTTNSQIRYQWQADGVDIVGATDSKYTLTQAEVGKQIKVLAIYTDDKGTNEIVESSDFGPVTNINDKGSVTIEGTARVNETLRAKVTDADGATGAITYEWLADGVGIGETGQTLVLTEAHFAKRITVTATYKDDAGNDENPTSEPTDLVRGRSGYLLEDGFE